MEHLLVDVRCVCPSSYAFAALKNDGSVVCWGCASAGGDCFAVQDNLHWAYGLLMSVHYGGHAKNSPGFDKDEQESEISEIAFLWCHFSVISGSICSMTISSVPNLQDQLHDVCQLSGATWAFTAVKNDGSAVTWGDERKGGDSSAVQDGSVQSDWLHRCKRRPLWIMALFGTFGRFGFELSGAARECEECLRIFLVLCSIET